MARKPPVRIAPSPVATLAEENAAFIAEAAQKYREIDVETRKRAAADEAARGGARPPAAAAKAAAPVAERVAAAPDRVPVKLFLRLSEASRERLHAAAARAQVVPRLMETALIAQCERWLKGDADAGALQRFANEAQMRVAQVRAPDAVTRMVTWKVTWRLIEEAHQIAGDPGMMFAHTKVLGAFVNAYLAAEIEKGPRP